MGTHLIDLRQTEVSSRENLPGLYAYLRQLVGEPFRFARVSYGDELTLHFGDLKPARSPKLKHKTYGSFILGLRGSSWVLKSGSESADITAGLVYESSETGFGTPLTRLSKQELETGTFVEPESRVIEAVPFVVKQIEGFWLRIRMSDASNLLILPTASEPDEPEDEGLPRLADWELSTPRGLLSAGPDLEWSFTPARNPTPDR